jgi:hypothetical protein
MMHIAVSLLERVQAHRILELRGVEVSDIIRSMRRDAVEQLFRHIPVRIDKAHPSPLMDVLEDQVPKSVVLPVPVWPIT